MRFSLLDLYSSFVVFYDWFTTRTNIIDAVT